MSYTPGPGRPPTTATGIRRKAENEVVGAIFAHEFRRISTWLDCVAEQPGELEHYPAEVRGDLRDIIRFEVERAWPALEGRVREAMDEVFRYYKWPRTPQVALDQTMSVRTILMRSSLYQRYQGWWPGQSWPRAA